jgi:hypothetical protein
MLVFYRYHRLQEYLSSLLVYLIYLVTLLFFSVRFSVIIFSLQQPFYHFSNPCPNLENDLFNQYIQQEDQNILKLREKILFQFE